MKKILFLVAMLTIAAVPAMAQSTGFDNYHYGTSMNCSDCHSMHASAHNNLTDGSAITASATLGSTTINPYYPAPNPGTGRHYLLKNVDVCASCHDAQTWAPDVIGDNNGTAYVRSAGGVKTTEVTGGGHKIGSTIRPPGYLSDAVVNPINGYFPAGSALECYSCHSPHGAATYRNLGPYQMRTTIGMGPAANVLPQYAKQTTWVNQDAVINVDTRTWGTSPLPEYYGRAAVKYGRKAAGSEITFGNVTASNRMDHFCGVCHGNFHGGTVTAPVGDGTAFVKHPTSIVTVAGAGTTWAGLPAATAGNLKVYTELGDQAAATSSPGCLTCHKAHGNNNPFALIYPSRTAADTDEEGDGIYKDLCKSCHPMGGA